MQSASRCRPAVPCGSQRLRHKGHAITPKGPSPLFSLPNLDSAPVHAIHRIILARCMCVCALPLRDLEAARVPGACLPTPLPALEPVCPRSASSFEEDHHPRATLLLHPSTFFLCPERTFCLSSTLTTVPGGIPPSFGRACRARHAVWTAVACAHVTRG